MTALRSVFSKDGTTTVAGIAGLGMVAIWLFLAGVVGAIKVSSEETAVQTGGGLEPDASGLLLPDDEGLAPGDPSDPTAAPVDADGDGVPDDPSVPVDADGDGVPDLSGGGSAPAPGGGGDGGGGNGGGGGGGTTPPPTNQQSSGGDRTGVSDTEIKIGIHAPKTIGGAPLNLAEDPIKGLEAYTKFINDNGGINGRKLKLDIQDDRYEASGGSDAAKRLIENKNFIISGTLGVDQINVVANEAAKAGIPYHAAGGGEPDFARLGIYQVSTSYDTHVVQLARFLAQDAKYKGKKVGISALNSALIKPSVEVFKAEAKRMGVNVVETVYIQKPTEQSSYTAEINKLKSAGVQVFVPLQDPVSTSRQVSECITALCGWEYTFSNFAHDGDTTLTLMGGEWSRQKVRGLSGSCYYLHPNAYNPAHCARMDKAHAQWVKVYDQADWEKDGQGGASGYQIISMLAEALRRSGPDLTRQRYAAAIRTYDAYSDLITSPITFAGKSSFAHGSDKMVVYEAQSNDKYKQLTPGFVQF